MRVSEEFREVLAEEIQRLKDPRIGFVTITGVKVTDDLHLATIYFTVIGNDEQKTDSAAGLNSAKGFIRREMGKTLKMRYVPDLIFRYDASVEYGNRIEGILREIHTGEEHVE